MRQVFPALLLAAACAVLTGCSAPADQESKESLAEEHENLVSGMESESLSFGEPSGDSGLAEDRSGWESKIRAVLPPLEILAVEGEAPAGTGVVADLGSREIQLHYHDELYLEMAEESEENHALWEATQGVTYAQVTVAGPTHTIASDYAIWVPGSFRQAEAEFLLCENLVEDPYPVTVEMMAVWQPQPEGVNCTIGPSAHTPGAFDITVRSEEPKIWVLNFNYLRMDAPDLQSVLPGYEPTPGKSPFESASLIIGAREGGMDTAVTASPVEEQEGHSF